MGLLDDSGADRDYEVLLDVAWGVAELWNNFGGPQKHHFVLRIGENELRECCRRGDEILIQSRRFPNPPSPFKRVAALVVLARLFPFFELDPATEYHQEQIWLSRLSALLIPGAISVLEVNLSEDPANPKWTPGKWNGFASPHYKIEFIKFIQWLDNFDWLVLGTEGEKWKQTKRERLARMVMAVSLIIEANYYIGETGPPKPEYLRGKCKLCIKPADSVDLTYDTEIYDNAEKEGYFR